MNDRSEKASGGNKASADGKGGFHYATWLGEGKSIPARGKSKKKSQHKYQTLKKKWTEDL